MSEQKFLPSIVSEYKRRAMYPIMKEFYDTANPSKDVAQRLVKGLEGYLEYIYDSPYSTGPGYFDVPDRRQFMPVVIEEVQWAGNECARIRKEFHL